MTPLTLTLMVGVSGSGKSTHAAKLAQSLPADIVEPDAIRKELTGNASDQSRNREVFQLAHSRAEAKLLAGINVVVDATNLDRKTRAEWLAIARRCGAEARAVVVDTPVDVAKKRNLSRSRVVPLDVIDKQASRFCPPTVSEGFAHIATV